MRDLDGDEDRGRDLGAVPLPAGEVDEHIGAGGDQREDGGEGTDATGVHDAAPLLEVRDGVVATMGSWSAVVTLDGAGVAVDRDAVAVGEAAGGVGDADDGGHAVLTSEDRQVAERVAGLGDETAEPGDAAAPGVDRDG